MMKNARLAVAMTMMQLPTLALAALKPGCHDKEGNLIMTIINRCGVHEIGIRWQASFLLHFTTQRWHLHSGL
jgi:hypothetical protein